MTSVDLSFPAMGGLLLIDHGYLLCAGVKKRLEELGHIDEVRQLVADKTIGLRVIARRGLKGHLELRRGSSFRIRLSPVLIPNFLALSGQQVRVGRESIRLGVPSIHALVPTTELYARVVTIKGFQTPNEFMVAARKQVANLGLADTVELTFARQRRGERVGEPIRRVVRIREKTVVGFALEARCATREASLQMQSHGIGGRRHFGAGIFLPKPQQNGK